MCEIEQSPNTRGGKVVDRKALMKLSTWVVDKVMDKVAEIIGRKEAISRTGILVEISKETLTTIVVVVQEAIMVMAGQLISAKSNVSSASRKDTNMQIALKSVPTEMEVEQVEVRMRHL